MKTTGPFPPHRRAERGMIAVVAVIAMLIILSLLLMANGRVTRHLRRGIALVENQQQRRLGGNALPAPENAAPAQAPSISTP